MSWKGNKTISICRWHDGIPEKSQRIMLKIIQTIKKIFSDLAALKLTCKNQQLFHAQIKSNRRYSRNKILFITAKINKR